MADERPKSGLRPDQEHPKPIDARQAIVDLTLATGIIQQSIDFLSGQGSTSQLSQDNLERLAGLSAEMQSIVAPAGQQELQSVPNEPQPDVSLLPLSIYPPISEVAHAERLAPFPVTLPWQVHGKKLYRGAATDFQEMSSESRGYIYDYDISLVIHSVGQDTYGIEQTVIAANREIRRDQPAASVYFVNWHPQKGLGVVHIQRLREDFGTPEGESSRSMRPYLHKEFFGLGNGSKVLELIKKGYAVFPYLTISDPRFNFNCEQLLRKSMTLEDASQATVGDNQPGNFWSDCKLAHDKFLPVIAKTVSAIRKGDQALVLAIDPVTRQPLDISQKILFFQLIQQLLPVDNQSGLISFSSSPVFYRASDLTLREPTEGRTKPNDGKRLIEVDPSHVELTSDEEHIVTELGRLFLGQIPWLDAHHEWLQTVGPRLLPKSRT